MSHLILPIDIDGTKYCVKHGASTPKWRTIGQLTGGMTLTGTEDDDEWYLSGLSDFFGIVTFGTCCLWKATVRFTLEPSDYPYYGAVNINEIERFYFSRDDSTGETIDYVVDLNALGLMGRACGNIWGIGVETYEGDISVEIVNVTFGPPV